MNLLQQFFNKKNPQTTYRFRIRFSDEADKFRPNGEKMPILEYYDVSNISLPTYAFKKEIQKYGNFPKSFPVLDHEGFEISVLFEETANHDVGRFINWLQRKIIQEDGIYNPPDYAKFTEMILEVLSDRDKVVAKYSFPNVYYMRTQNPVFDYNTSEILRYEIIFGSDIQNLEIFDLIDNYSPTSVGDFNLNQTITQTA